MGGLNFLGMGGGTAKPIGGSGSKPSMSNYKFVNARKTKIKAGKDTFGRQVSDVKWKANVRSAGKKEFKLLRGENKGQILKDVDLKKEVGEILKKRGGRGITGNELKKQLVRKVGMGFKDAETIARAATLHYYEPPAEGGISDKDALINARAGLRSAEMVDEKQNMAGKLQNRREDTKKDIASKKGDYTDLDISAQDKHQASVSGQVIDLDKVRKEKKASANIQSGGKASVDGHDDAAGIGGRHGNQAEDKKKTTTPQKSSQTVQISHGSVSMPGKDNNNDKLNSDSQEPSGNAVIGGVVDKYGNVIDLNKKREEKASSNVIEEIRAREEAKKAAAVNDEGDVKESSNEEEVSLSGTPQPEFGQADDYEDEKKKKAA